MAKSIVHSLAQMVILAQRNAAKAAIAADLQYFFGWLLALPDLFLASRSTSLATTSREVVQLAEIVPNILMENCANSVDEFSLQTD